MSKKILIIDDVQDTIDILTDRLEPLGYEVEGRVNPKEGQWATSKNRPDLIVLDINMPGWRDGLGFMTSLKHHPNLLGIPILIYTSLKDPEIRAKAVEGGAAGFFVKLEEDSALLDRIKALLAS